MVYNPFGAGSNPAQVAVPAQMVNTPATGQVPSNSSSGAPQGAPKVIPFLQAAKEHIEIGPTYSGLALNGKFTPNVPAYGYLESLVLQVQGVGGVGGAATVATTEDAPWDIISQFILNDPSGLQLANLTGYEWYVSQRYDGESLFAIESDTNSFTAVATGAGASGNFNLRLPYSLRYGQGGRGSLADSNQAATFKAQALFGGSAALYTVAPATTLPTLQGQIESIHRMIPQPQDLYHRAQQTTPPIPGSYIVRSSQQQAVVNGNNTFFLARVGNVLRSIILIFRDSTGSRSGANSGGTLPTSIEMDWDTGVKYIVNVATLQQRVFRKTGLIVPTSVVPFLFLANDGAGGLFVGDDGSQYVPTLGGTKIKFTWNSTASGGSVDAVVCDIVTRDGGVSVTDPGGAFATTGG